MSRDPENGILQACRDNGTNFVAYSPMSRGLLTGTLDAETIKKNGDARRNFPRFSDDNIEHNLGLVGMLEELAKNKKCSTAQIALAWVLNQDDHIYIIPGIRREKYLLENFHSQDIKLEDNELEALRLHFSEDQVSGSRYPEIAMTGINE